MRSTGRGGVIVTPRVLRTNEIRMIQLDDIYRGLTEGEFFLEYQPIVSLDCGRCWGAEALIRWRRSDGVAMPSDFIPMIESTPVSGVLTYWVIDQLAQELGDWLKDNPEATLCINVPPEILGRGGLEYAARKSGLLEVAGQIILEITEKGIPDRLGLEALNSATRRTGVRIALDDVSLTGANLALLARFSVDFIKIDRALVEELEGLDPCVSWLDALPMLLRSTPVQVIAEGVETSEQLCRLRRAGIPLAQGFLLSRPLDAARFRAYYQASHTSAARAKAK